MLKEKKRSMLFRCAFGQVQGSRKARFVASLLLLPPHLLHLSSSAPDNNPLLDVIWVFFSAKCLFLAKKNRKTVLIRAGRRLCKERTTTTKKNAQIRAGSGLRKKRKKKRIRARSDL